MSIDQSHAGWQKAILWLSLVMTIIYGSSTWTTRRIISTEHKLTSYMKETRKRQGGLSVKLREREVCNRFILIHMNQNRQWSELMKWNWKMHRENEGVGLIIKEKSEVYLRKCKSGLSTLRWICRKPEVHYCSWC